jgi:hypothetical protein
MRVRRTTNKVSASYRLQSPLLIVNALLLGPFLVLKTTPWLFVRSDASGLDHDRIIIIRMHSRSKSQPHAKF